MKTKRAPIFAYNQWVGTVTGVALAAWLVAGCGQPQQTGEPSGPSEAEPGQQQPAPPQPEGEPEAESPSEPSQEEQEEGEEAEPNAQAAPAGGGSVIMGTVTLKGEPPAETKIPLDPACGKLHDEELFTQFYVVGQNNALADVFVHIKEGLGDQSFETPSEAKVLDQEGCVYKPYVFGIQTGQTLTVKNSDPVLHNVHTVPGPDSKNKERNVAQLPAPQGQDLTFNFPAEEIFLKFKCDVHPWMYSYAGIVDHPYYAVTAEDGSYKLAGLPAGDYVVEAYHRKAGKVTQEVSVKDGETKTVDFTVKVPQG